MAGISVSIRDWNGAGPTGRTMASPSGRPEVTVVIDVLRAFTTAAILLGRGARRILCFRDAFEASTATQTLWPPPLVVGEQVEPPFPVVDLPNSPRAALTAPVQERLVVLFTANGTRALLDTSPAATVLATSLVNAGATAEWIRQHRPHARVGLVVTDPLGPEDRGCAQHLEALLTNGVGRAAAAVAAVAAGVESHRRRWGDHVPPAVWASFAADGDVCAQLDAWPVVMHGARDLGAAVTLGGEPVAPQANRHGLTTISEDGKPV